jgi:hypothetical protein
VGIARDLRVRVPTRHLIAAMRAATPVADDLDTREAIEAGLEGDRTRLHRTWDRPAPEIDRTRDGHAAGGGIIVAP